MTLSSVVPYIHAEEHWPLIAPSGVFPVVALCLFTVLGFITWSYRDVANRHAGKKPRGGGHGPTV